MLRKIIPWLPSFAAPFKRSEPLTRIRDIAHRNDIPSELKKEIKTTLQNKLHRCAGPEDLQTAADILARIEGHEDHYSPDFVREFRTFYEELQEFFNARSLEDRLISLVEDGDRLAEPAEELLSAKRASDGSLAGLFGQLQSLTRLRRSGLKMRQRDKPGPDRLFQLLLLDVALEEYAFVVASRAVNALEPIRPESLPRALALAGILTENIGLSGLEPGECRAIYRELAALEESGGTGGRVFLLRMKACLERALRLTEVYSSRIALLFTEGVERLGTSLGVPEHAISFFSEGDIRGHIVFQLSKIAGTTTSHIRRVLHTGQHDVLVPGTVSGTVVRAAAIKDVEDRGLPCIVLLDKAAGDECIPSRIRGIILLHDLPHLSHLAIRARQEGVVLVTSPEKELGFQVREAAGRHLTFSADSRGFRLTEGSREAAPGTGPARKNTGRTPQVRAAAFAGQYTLDLRDISEENAGAKADSLRKLHQLSASGDAGFLVPEGLVIPFGVMEKAVNDNGLRQRYEQLLPNGKGGDCRQLERRMKDLISSLSLPREITKAVKSRFAGEEALMVRSSSNCEDLQDMAGAGLYDSIPDVAPGDIEDAVRSVWASLWNRRAVMSRTDSGIPHNQARMAVCIQPCLDPDYCFVMHTVNPLTAGTEEIYMEIAPGRGEILASGNVRGTPYRIRVNKKNNRAAILAFANYSIRLQAGGSLVNDYSTIRLTTDEAWRRRLVKTLARAAIKVEQALGAAQDIEGAVLGGTIHLVQTRPQIQGDSG